MVDETIEPRRGQELPRERVQAYLRQHLADLPEAPLEIRQFPAGASNLTYLLRLGEWEAVLRRPPPGPLPPRAHDMPREFRLLERLHPAFPLAPRPFLLCEDAEVLGAPFYVMERKRGIVLDQAFPPEVPVDAALCRRLSLNVVDTLAWIHDVDWQATGLGDLSHAQGFLDRQVHGWIERYGRARTEDVPTAERLTSWLAANVPESPAPTLIHNDFKLNNMVVSGADPAEPVGVLDWEMSTVGDPLFDLAISLCYWVETGDPAEMRRLLPTVTSQEGFLGRQELMERYAKRAGRDLSAMQFYLTFAYFKLAGILQQIYARWKRAQMQDERFAGFGERVRFLIWHAEATQGLHQTEAPPSITRT
jgi:aminoglycoside phosphotransferase (APT) family kinase protein